MRIAAPTGQSLRLWAERLYLRARYRDPRDRAIAALRLDLAALGYPVDHLTDEEIEEGVRRLGEIVAETGVTAAEAIAAFSRLRTGITARELSNGIR